MMREYPISPGWLYIESIRALPKFVICSKIIDGASSTFPLWAIPGLQQRK
jgi:hypothetical protein